MLYTDTEVIYLLQPKYNKIKELTRNSFKYNVLFSLSFKHLIYSQYCKWDQVTATFVTCDPFNAFLNVFTT